MADFLASNCCTVHASLQVCLAVLIGVMPDVMAGDTCRALIGKIQTPIVFLQVVAAKHKPGSDLLGMQQQLENSYTTPSAGELRD